MSEAASDLIRSKPATLDVQTLYTKDGLFCVVFMRDERGKAITHWICSDKDEVNGIIKAFEKFNSLSTTGTIN